LTPVQYELEVSALKLRLQHLSNQLKKRQKRRLRNQ